MAPLERFSTRTNERGLRAIALFEAGKGVVVLAAGSGLLLLVHRSAQMVAERIVSHLHLNPANRYPRIFVHAFAGATPGRLRLFALGALVYAAVRFLEAAGLWHGRRWAEWFGVWTSLIYVPFEVWAFVRKPGIEPLLAVALNIAVMLFLKRQLRA